MRAYLGERVDPVASRPTTLREHDSRVIEGTAALRTPDHLIINTGCDSLDPSLFATVLHESTGAGRTGERIEAEVVSNDEGDALQFYASGIVISSPEEAIQFAANVISLATRVINRRG